MLRKLDREIIVKLMEDSRSPIYRIARELGVSRQAVAKRLEKLKREGMVKFTAIPDPKSLGLMLKAYILVRVAPGDEVRSRFENKVKRLRQVSQVHYVYGRFDVLIEVLVKDHDELSRLVKSLHRLKGVLETETYIVREPIKDRFLDPLLRALKAS
ncbi:MAG: hypothetical protein DRJ98_07145 [Thermoprotei archaeon]|nr:MAG: hypothetical protein DRJ98_07145 [Thermoprotei archaeon]RLF13419.1 MAG: hypothetical protein DRN06_08660 [Thermoprotei archaeon]